MWDWEGGIGSLERNDGKMVGCGGRGLKRTGDTLPISMSRVCAKLIAQKDGRN